MRLTLQHMKRKPETKSRFDGRKVRIWSGQWKAWWRPEASGYTDHLPDAGVYDFGDAWYRSSHCGPEKKISYVVVNERAVEAKGRAAD